MKRVPSQKKLAGAASGAAAASDSPKAVAPAREYSVGFHYDLDSSFLGKDLLLRARFQLPGYMRAHSIYLLTIAIERAAEIRVLSKLH